MLYLFQVVTEIYGLKKTQVRFIDFKSNSSNPPDPALSDSDLVIGVNNNDFIPLVLKKKSRFNNAVRNIFYNIPKTLREKMSKWLNLQLDKRKQESGLRNSEQTKEEQTKRLHKKMEARQEASCT